jgi:hypothetical protein
VIPRQITGRVCKGSPNGTVGPVVTGPRAGDVRLPRRPVVEGLVGPQGVVGAAEQAEFDSEGVAIADDRAVEVLVFQGAEEPFDHVV